MNKIQVCDKVLENAKKYLVSLTERWTSGVCFGACLSLAGNEIQPGHVHCHSWVGHQYQRIQHERRQWSTRYNPGAEPFLVLSCHSKKRNSCSDEASDAIVLWVARESPFSQFVLNRDDEESLLNGGVILLCGPGGLTEAQSMWICKVLRYGTEGGKALDTWLALVQGGVNPLLAILVASHVRTVKGTTFGYTGLEGHSTVFRSADVASLVAGKINPKAEDTTSVFLHSSTKDSVHKIRSFCAPSKIEDGWGGFIERQGVEQTDLVQRALEWQHQITAEFTQEKMP